VVPVDGQAWASDPFTCVLRAGRYYGRGAADMKGFLACVLALAPGWQTAPLRRPIHLAFSYDEEVGCKGVPGLLDRMLDRLPVRPLGCVVGEPTLLQVSNGHKGKGGYACTVTGRASHSALNHLGVNAVEIAALLIAELRRMNGAFRLHGPWAEGFEPAHTTVSAGRIEGGGALNIVPARCRFEFEFRTLPGQDAAALLARLQAFAERELLPGMRQAAPEARIDWSELMSYPALGDGPADGLEALACRLTGTTHPDKLSFGTEAGHFAQRGIPAIVCGPGSIEVAHRADEYVEAAQLQACEAFLGRLVDHMALA
jgi:acetylornithine deacetylase